jgi:hypothetical protein
MDMYQEWQLVAFKISLQLAFNLFSTAEMTYKQRNAVQKPPTSAFNTSAQIYSLPCYQPPISQYYTVVFHNILGQVAYSV